ncbi:MAG: hypothetical protein ABSG64_12490 [Solirubrobacteraceae bacterium]|jgi:hypothetical protein
MASEPLRATVTECIREAAVEHPWLQDAILAGRTPDLTNVSADEGLAALASLLGGVIRALELVADEVERQGMPPEVFL